MTVKPHPRSGADEASRSDSQAVRASRLDEEPMPRRDFLGRAALWSAASAMFLAVLGIARLPRAAVLPSPSKKYRVTLPASMADGVAFVPQGRSVAIVRDADGIYAISTVCTHLGCIVKHTPEGFECPCHGSRFGGDGHVVRGPAPKALSWLALQDTGGGTIMIDEGKVVAAGTKVKVA